MPAIVTPQTSLPVFIKPQLPVSAASPPQGAGWVHEVKFDGYRALARVENGTVKILTREGHDWTGRFKSVADDLTRLKLPDSLIDGEIACLNDDGTMSLHGMQRASENQHRLHYYAFDLLHLEKQSLLDAPLLARKQALEEIWPKEHPRLHYSHVFTENGARLLEHVRRLNLEGIVSKKTNSRYRSGRDRNWLKIKCRKQQEMVIGGFTLNRWRQVASLYVGVFEGGNLMWAGAVRTGFSSQDAALLTERLLPLVSPLSAFADLPDRDLRHVHWVKPELVAEIAFLDWNPRGLRDASFKGLREDKKAETVQREYPERSEPPKVQPNKSAGKEPTP